MPITPFHFGPGAALHALAPKQVSFLAFCMANVLIDVEPLYYMLTQQFPLHRFWHTGVGASLVLLASVALFAGARKAASLVRLPNVFSWQELTFRPVAIGAALGGYSHLVFDSFMHDDIRPLAPFSDANPLLHAVSLGTLHWSCIAAGIGGAAILAMRKAFSPGKSQA